MNEENKRQGFLTLYRSLFKSDLWLSEKFTEGQAWIDLIYMARYKDGYIKIKNGQILKLKIGECGVSVVGFSERWRWSQGKVKRFLERLKNEKMIELKSEGNRSIINILNYEFYQNDKVNEQVNDKVNSKVNDKVNEQVNGDNRNKVINVIKENKENKDVVEDVVEEKIYGDYNNVLLEKSDYQKLLGIALSQKLLDECINDLSENIAQGKEQPYKADFPKAHFVRVKNYIEYRRKHPTTSKTHKIRGQENFEKSMEEWRLKNG